MKGIIITRLSVFIAVRMVIFVKNMFIIYINLVLIKIKINHKKKLKIFFFLKSSIKIAYVLKIKGLNYKN